MVKEKSMAWSWPEIPPSKWSHNQSKSIFTTIGIAVRRCSASALTIIETARVHTGIKEEMTKNRRRRRPKKEINKFCGVCANLEAVCNQRTETIELIRVYKITLRCYFENVECACTVSIFQAQISPTNISIGLYITVTSRCSFYFISQCVATIHESSNKLNNHTIAYADTGIQHENRPKIIITSLPLILL